VSVMSTGKKKGKLWKITDAFSTRGHVASAAQAVAKVKREKRRDREVVRRKHGSERTCFSLY
jgi:hypothetical protein